MDTFLALCFILFMIGRSIYNSSTRSKHIFTREELDAMNMEMVGKSTKECQQILKKYQK